MTSIYQSRTIFNQTKEILLNLIDIHDFLSESSIVGDSNFVPSLLVWEQINMDEDLPTLSTNGLIRRVAIRHCLLGSQNVYYLLFKY